MRLLSLPLLLALGSDVSCNLAPSLHEPGRPQLRFTLDPLPSSPPLAPGASRLVLATEPLSPDPLRATHTSLQWPINVTILSSESRNGLWLWRVGCVDRPSDYPLNVFTRNCLEPITVKPWQGRRPKCDACWPPLVTDGQCFRAVVDNFLSPKEVLALRALGGESIARRLAGHALNELEPARRQAVERVRDMFELDFGAGQGRLKLTELQHTIYDAEKMQRDWGKDRARWTALHSDFQVSVGYLYSAVLFLSTSVSPTRAEQEGEEWRYEVDPQRQHDTHVGGETGFLDKAEGSCGPVSKGIRLHRNGGWDASEGLVVEAKAGRALLFSGGDENLHDRMTMFAGRREVMVLWFSCCGLEDRQLL